MATGGKKFWYFADGYLPENKANTDYHESLILLNTQDKDTKVKISLYFSDKDPIENIEILVDAKRVKALRMDHEEDIKINIPKLTHYSVKVESELPIVVQFGRMDDGICTYYIGTPYSED